jgi:hypothetical protein
MSTEPQNNPPKTDWSKWIYAAAFTIVNTVICVLVTHDINPWHAVLLFLIFTVAVFAIIYDTLESMFEKYVLTFFEKWLFPAFFIVVVLIFVSSILSTFLPKWSTSIKGTIFDNMPYISSSLALLAIYLVFKRDLKYKKTVDEKELDLQVQITELQKLTDNINKINDRLIKYNPLYSTEATFKNAIDHLQDVSVADVALDFSIESLKQMGKLGFLKIDVSFGDYTQKLFDIVGKSKSSVLGSFTFRPKLIYDEIQSNSNAENNSNLKYLKLLNEKTYTNKIRLVILSKDEIKEILNDALESLTNTVDATLIEIPEVNWFKEQASKGFKVFWTSKNMFYNQFVSNEQEEIKKLISLPDNTVTDFAIFDGDLLITWRKSVENKSDMAEYGTLLISWNRLITKFHKEMSKNDLHQSAKHLYTDFMALVNKLKADDTSIKDLVDKIEAKKKGNHKWKNDYLPIT